MRSSEVKVSVLCIAYNHANYIELALRGFIDQKLDVAYEVLVHDDASTDGTAKVIEEYAKRYPDVIKAVLQKENQFSKGVNPNVVLMDMAKGEFIALCEGDDYWIDPLKLQKQYDALQRHPNIDLCFHPAKKVQNQKMLGVRNERGMSEKVISPQAVIKGRGAFMPTASIMLKKNTIYPFPDWFIKHAPVGDSFIQAMGSARGGALYLPESMAAYRVMSEGSISSANVRKKRSSEEIMRRYEGYQQSYNGLLSLVPEALYPSIKQALAISCYECLVDAIRIEDLALCREIAGGIQGRALESSFRSLVKTLVQSWLGLKVLGVALELKRARQ